MNHRPFSVKGVEVAVAPGGDNRGADAGGRYPDFIIIGAARSGTTTLADYLALHPRIFMCDPKEPFYFSHQSIYANGDGWYRALFARARDDQTCGEASTSYSVWPDPDCGDVAARIAKTIPRLKIIYIMRHPVARAYSGYDYDMTRLGLNLTFEEALEQDDRFVAPGLYMQQIERYLRYFDRSSFLFLLLDDLAAAPDETLARVWHFLEVDPRPVQAAPRVVNSAAEHYVRMHTTQRIRLLPGVSRLADAIPRRWRDGAFQLFMSSPVYRWFAAGHRPRPMLPETRRRLLERFKEPNRELAEFLKRDLSAWSR